MQDRKEKFLSQTGKEILIKSVIQAIPTYAMLCFLIPKRICDDINAMIRKFWWGKRNNRKGIAWRSWSIMYNAKSVGVIGFRELEAFNFALAKQGWRLLKTLILWW